jgi:F-type H+/Na+-transporting ATPase subunit alpha
MSQVDFIHFFPVLIWVIILFILWYGFVVVLIIPKYYKVMRSRVEIEKLLYSTVKQDEYLLKLIKIYFFNWIKEITKLFNLNMVISFTKNNLEGKNEKKNYVEIENINEIGFVYKVSDDIVYARGLLKVQMSEMVKFTLKDGGVIYGIVNYLDNEGVAGITVLGDASGITAQTVVERVYIQPKIQGGYDVLGRILNPIGEPLDGKGKLASTEQLSIEKIAPGIISRKPVREPLETGIKFIDSMIPIGCGQRELIIGDKKTGKTAIAIDTILNQKGTDTICVYVAIGQKKSSVARVSKILREKDCINNVIIVAASASDAAALQYLAPYSGCALGEYFRDLGRKVVIIYDDLSKHAVAYRQMSLLLRRPPGREGYPGDVFYIHSRLLERSAKLRGEGESFNDVLHKKKNDFDYAGGSLTALPIIETIQGDVSAYIPTNVISITDGQIFLEASLFNRGIRPAINPGISVSRVGSSAQNKVIKKLAGSLKLELAQYREMEEFARLGLSLDESTMYLLEKGRRLVQLLNQTNYNPINMVQQLVLLFCGLRGVFSDVTLDNIIIFEKKIIYLLNDASIFAILNVLSRTELMDDFIMFFVNMLKIYLLVENK